MPRLRRESRPPPPRPQDVPGRPIGIWAVQSLCASAVIARVMSVSISPGATTFTVTLREATSFASDLQKPIRPGLRRGVIRLAGVADLPDDRADGDDAAAPLPDHGLERPPGTA